MILVFFFFLLLISFFLYLRFVCSCFYRFFFFFERMLLSLFHLSSLLCRGTFYFMLMLCYCSCLVLIFKGYVVLFIYLCILSILFYVNLVSWGVRLSNFLFCRFASNVVFIFFNRFSLVFFMLCRFPFCCRFIVLCHFRLISFICCVVFCLSFSWGLFLCFVLLFSMLLSFSLLGLRS